MWVAVAAFAFLLFYFLIIRWYLPLWWDVPEWDRPLGFSRSQFHVTVWLIGIFLLLASVVALFMVRWWLSFVPLILFFALIARHRLKRESQINATIKKAILLHSELKQEGLSEQDIYKQIAKQLTSTIAKDELFIESSVEWATLETLLEYNALPLNKLWHCETQASAAVRHADLRGMHERIKGFQESFERERAATPQSEHSQGDKLPVGFREPMRRELTDEERAAVLEHMRQRRESKQ